MVAEKVVVLWGGVMVVADGDGLGCVGCGEQLYEIVTLVNELLPPLADGQGGGAGSSSSSGASGCRGGRKYSGVTMGSKAEEGGGGAAGEASAREILLREQPELLEQFSNDLFPVLVQVR